MQVPYQGVISVAGLDPTGGAGIIADAKTFDSLGVVNCTVPSSLTWQNDISFTSVEWLGLDSVERHFALLAKRYTFAYGKIGLVKDPEWLLRLISLFEQYFPGIRLVWDPILKASAGFEFHDLNEAKAFEPILERLYLVTPNLEEARLLWDIHTAEEAESRKWRVNLLLKGGHDDGKYASDHLLIPGKPTAVFARERLAPEYFKHGTGCILSAAITALLAKGHTLEKACWLAKEYVYQYMRSTRLPIGVHKPLLQPETTLAHA